MSPDLNEAFLRQRELDRARDLEQAAKYRKDGKSKCITCFFERDADGKCRCTIRPGELPDYGSGL